MKLHLLITPIKIILDTQRSLQMASDGSHRCELVLVPLHSVWMKFSIIDGPEMVTKQLFEKLCQSGNASHADILPENRIQILLHLKGAQNKLFGQRKALVKQRNKRRAN